MIMIPEPKALFVVMIFALFVFLFSVVKQIFEKPTPDSKPTERNASTLMEIYSVQTTQLETLIWKFLFYCSKWNIASNDISVVESHFIMWTNALHRMSNPELPGLLISIDTTSKSGMYDWVSSRKHKIREMKQFIHDLRNDNYRFGKISGALNKLDLLLKYLELMESHTTNYNEITNDYQKHFLTEEFMKFREKM